MPSYPCLTLPCTEPAFEVRRYVLESTDGPIEHIQLVCTLGHIFNGPLEMFDARP